MYRLFTISAVFHTTSRNGEEAFIYIIHQPIDFSLDKGPTLADCPAPSARIHSNQAIDFSYRLRSYGHWIETRT